VPARVNLGNSSLIAVWLFFGGKDWLEEKRAPELCQLLVTMSSESMKISMKFDHGGMEDARRDKAEEGVISSA